jgi:hypothetical protein
MTSLPFQRLLWPLASVAFSVGCMPDLTRVPTESPEKTAALEWAHDNLSRDWVEAVCEGDSCIVWGIYSSHGATTPPIYLRCPPTPCTMILEPTP